MVPLVTIQKETAMKADALKRQILEGQRQIREFEEGVAIARAELDRITRDQQALEKARENAESVVRLRQEKRDLERQLNEKETSQGNTRLIVGILLLLLAVGGAIWGPEVVNHFNMLEKRVYAERAVSQAEEGTEGPRFLVDEKLGLEILGFGENKYGSYIRLFSHGEYMRNHTIYIVGTKRKVELTRYFSIRNGETAPLHYSKENLELAGGKLFRISK